MTSKAIFYYTQTGKTESIIDKSKIKDIDLYCFNNLDEKDVNFDDYEVIYIGSPTYGRGAPPKYFLSIIQKLNSLKGKKIGLFGSGNTIYGDDFCGALDVLEEILRVKNKIIFKYKVEGMALPYQIEELSKKMRGD